MRSLRIAFLGNDAWSVPPLRALAASSHELVAVVTAAPKPAGRGNRPRPTPVAVAARELALAFHEVETVRRGPGLEALREPHPDVLAVVAYGEILPPEVLGLASLAPVNLHFSLLPELRGASPVQSALLRGMERTGVTTIVMDEGLDTGPVLLQREAEIAPGDDAGSLGARLAELGAVVLVETVDLLARGEAAPRPQDPARATVTRRLRTEDRVLDFSASAVDLVNRVRAMAPEPAATTTFRGGGLKVFRADAVPADGEAGTIVEVSKDAFVVGTASAGFRPLELAPAGGRRMAVADFVHGHRPSVGERLG